VLDAKWRVTAFVALFVALQWSYASMAGTWLERFVIDGLTVVPAAVILGLVDPALHVTASGSRLAAPGGGLNVLNGCEGTDIAFLVLSAMAVAPLSLAARLAGMTGGLALVFLLNQARILALFYAFRQVPASFDLLHGLVAPLALVVACSAFFLFWLARFGARATDDARPAARAE
jgi:exosortase family protein XrtM